MGLLNFLRKPDNRSVTNLKAQAYRYDATTPTLPPLKGSPMSSWEEFLALTSSGTYPVAGNGHNLDHLRRSRTDMSDTNLSTNTKEGWPASARLVPHLLEVDPERPSTAPNVRCPPPQHATSARPQRDSYKGPPPLSFRKSRMDSISTPGRDPRLVNQESETGEVVFDRHPAIQPLSSKFLHSRHISIQSFSSGRFVDLLDAQSEIKPADFRSRVRAAGAKDYGEDVADRNMGENGHDLALPVVKAFYSSNATASHPSRRIKVACPSGAERMQSMAPRRPTSQAGHSRSLRTKSLNSSSFNPFPTSGWALLPREAGAPPERKQAAVHAVHDGYYSDYASHRRRQSTNSYVPRGAPGTTVARAATRLGPASSDYRQTQRPATSYHKSNELGIYTPSAARTHSSQYQPPLSPRKAHETAQSNHTTSTTRPVLGSREQHDSSAPITRPSTQRETLPSLASAYTSSRHPSKRHSLSSLSSTRPSNDWSVRPSNVGRIGIEGLHDGLLSPAAPSPHVMRAEPRTDSDTAYPRTRSLVSMRGKPRLDEIYEYIPMRTSSLRNWSLTSATPTYSFTSASSVPFPRPRTSHHTPNTSVDMPVFSPVATSSRSSITSGVHGSSYCTAVESRLHSPLTETEGGKAGEKMEDLKEGFNIDDYLSSEDDVDADSFVVCSEQKSKVDEESLLFRDVGYGVVGRQLPGLFDSIPEMPFPELHQQSPSQRLSRAFSPSVPATLFPVDGTGRHGRLPAKTYAPGYALDSEDDDDNDDDEEWLPRADLAPGRRGARRLSAIGSYAAIEEETCEKVDVRSAIRRRKEAKARKRAGLGRRRGRTEDDEENLADVE